VADSHVGHSGRCAQELRTWSALFRKNTPEQEVVAFSCSRQSARNTVRVADDVKQADEFGEQLPPGVQLRWCTTRSDFIRLGAFAA